MIFPIGLNALSYDLFQLVFLYYYYPPKSKDGVFIYKNMKTPSFDFFNVTVR